MNEPLLLVSFCNRPDDEGKVLAAVDAGGVRRWFDLAGNAPASACGMTYAGGSLLLACSDAHGSYVAVFDDSAQLRDYVKLANAGDVHSVCSDGAWLFAASTATDEIVRFPLSRLSAPAEVVWRAGAVREDCNHVNSLALADGRLLCGGFGRKNGSRWADAYDGFIYDVERGGYVLRGLFHPHSLVWQDGAIYFCESAEGSMRSIDGPLRYVNGYTRGLAFAGRTYFLGVSRGRRTNARARFVLNPADAGAAAGVCAVYTGEIGSNAPLRAVDLSAHAEEIYDVLPLPNAMYAAI